MLHKLTKIANQLDRKGFYKEASTIDLLLKQAIMSEEERRRYIGIPEDEKQQVMQIPEGGVMTDEQFEGYYGRPKPITKQVLEEIEEPEGLVEKFDLDEEQKKIEEYQDFITQIGPYKIRYYTRKRDGVRSRYIVIPGDMVWPEDLYPNPKKVKRRDVWVRIPDSITDDAIKSWDVDDIDEPARREIEERRDQTEEYFIVCI